MSSTHLSTKVALGVVRRGYSPSGGAEAYLKRFAQAAATAGHGVRLYATSEWPEAAWEAGEMAVIKAESPLKFADELERRRGDNPGEVLFSLERVWRCDVYRAGDGVHRAWLERRAATRSPLRRVGAFLQAGKHRELLRLEKALLGEGGAGQVIANSNMVRDEIVRCYGYPKERIHVVPNGVPLHEYDNLTTKREATRRELGLRETDIAVLFVGSGSERKGLAFAVAAIEGCRDERIQLLVAGRTRRLSAYSPRVRQLGVRHDLTAIYAAADIFLLPTLYDPFSNACLEALAAGLPVITTRDNGFSEVMDDGVHGTILDSPRDVGQIQRALLEWSEQTRRQQSREAILHRAGQFDLSVNVAKTLAILSQASAASTVG